MIKRFIDWLLSSLPDWMFIAEGTAAAGTGGTVPTGGSSTTAAGTATATQNSRGALAIPLHGQGEPVKESLTAGREAPPEHKAPRMPAERPRFTMKEKKRPKVVYDWERKGDRGRDTGRGGR